MRISTYRAPTQRPSPQRTMDSLDTHIPYLLSASDDCQWIYARGPYALLRELATVRSSQVKFDNDTGIRYVVLPASRPNVMICEAIASPTAVHENFIKCKRRAFAIDKSALNKIINATLCGRIKRPLLPHQVQFVALAMNRRGMLNASEQGTCKTSAAIATVEMRKCKRILVVAPKTLLPQWEDEINTTIRIGANDVIIRLEHGGVPDRAKALARIHTVVEKRNGNTRVFILTNYEALARLERAILTFGFDAVLFDESWKLKSRTTQVTRAAMRIAQSCTTVQHLTGTPIGNDVGDLWSQLTMVGTQDEVAEMGTYREWMDMYARMENMRGRRAYIKITGARNISDLMSVMEPMYFRATKATCLELPEKMPPERVRLTLSQPIRELYDRILDEGIEALSADGLDVLAQQGVNIRLQQLVGGFQVMGDINNQQVIEVPCPKLDWLWDFCDDVLVGDHTLRTIIWCKFNLEVDRIVREMQTRFPTINVVGVTGSGPHDKKDSEITDIKASFNSHHPDGIQVIVAQIKKMAYGHNLQGGCINVAYSHTWSHIERSQWEDRMHRQGVTRAVRYIDLIVTNSIDVDVLSCTDRKEDLAGRLTPDTVRRQKDNTQ